MHSYFKQLERAILPFLASKHLQVRDEEIAWFWTTGLRSDLCNWMLWKRSSQSTRIFIHNILTEEGNQDFEDLITLEHFASNLNNDMALSRSNSKISRTVTSNTLYCTVSNSKRSVSAQKIYIYQDRYWFLIINRECPCPHQQRHNMNLHISKYRLDQPEYNTHDKNSWEYDMKSLLYLKAYSAAMGNS